MKPHASLNRLAILALVLMACVNFVSQAQANDYRVIENRIVVDTSPEIAWEILADFTGVSEFHALFDESTLLRGEGGLVRLGSERETHIPDGMNNVILRERITHLKEGSFYSYKVFEWENIPLDAMQVTYGVGVNEAGQTEIYNRTVYRLRSGVVTGMARNKFEKGSRDSLISYKYYIETGQDETDLKKLRKWYKKRLKSTSDGDLLASNDGRNQ